MFCYTWNMWCVIYIRLVHEATNMFKLHFMHIKHFDFFIRNGGFYEMFYVNVHGSNEMLNKLMKHN